MRKASFSPWIMGAGLLAVVIAVLLWLQSDRSEAKATLVDEMGLVSQRVATLNLDTMQSTFNERQLEYLQAQERLDKERAVLVSENESTDVCDNLFAIAARCQVQIIGINSPGIIDSNKDGDPTQTLALSIEVTGEVVDTLRFVSQIHQAYPFGHVETVALDNPNGKLGAASLADYQDADMDPLATSKVNLLINQWGANNNG